MPARILVACFLVFAAAQASAVPLTVANYSTPNGNTGSYQYWDESYSPSPSPGCTTTDNCALSGGKGDLTDGIIATANWSVTEAPPGNGPYVGWTLNPTIVFNFASTVTINTITFYLDEARTGGVSSPSAINISAGSYSQSFLVPSQIGTAPFAFTANLGGVSAASFNAQLIRRTQWVFLSEVAFDGSPGTVPEPGTLALVSLGVVALVGRRGRMISRAERIEV